MAAEVEVITEQKKKRNNKGIIESKEKWHLE